MSDNEYDMQLDDGDEVDPEIHTDLVKAINKLDKTQHIKKPTRDGYSELKSEFHVSGSDRSASTVHVSDLINILQSKSEHADTGKKIKIAHKHSKALQKPVEKHEAEKIKRATGFEEVVSNLGKWDAIVSRNRTLEYQKFPLPEISGPKSSANKGHLSKFILQSELEKELNELQPPAEEPKEQIFPMTVTEMLEHRKEAARLRAKQSYKEVKARRQSKIKSKKFHRIQRKEKIKQQLKDFETLQKTDPEEALKKLEQLEKTRAQERVTLRHKSTGQWAKNKLVRAKYDKETRQQLAEQLAISRELTQKQNLSSETESEEETELLNGNLIKDSSNPWLPKVQSSNEVDDFVSGYKKYWEERNKTKAMVENEKEENYKQHLLNTENMNCQKTSIKEKACINGETHEKITNKLNQQIKKLEKQIPVVKSTEMWTVETVSMKLLPTKNTNLKRKKATISVDSIFEDLEWKMQNKAVTKLKSLKSTKSKTTKKKRIVSKEPEIPSSGLEFKKKIKRPDIDEALDESLNDSSKGNVNLKQNNTEILSHKNTEVNKEMNTNQIDPDKFVAIKPRHLISTLPDAEMGGDHLDDDENDGEYDRKITIAEAFEDDDIVAEFQQEKQNERDKNKPNVEDMNLPGWGSWAGKNFKTPKRKHRRMFLNIPKVIPRKDDKKENVIINESKDSKLRIHQVSELPFPFTTVSDFEASIRAPIGNTFIPETAHKKLVKPAVITKTGVIIEPMDESQLIKVNKNKNADFDFSKKL